MLEYQTEKNMENDMETGLQGLQTGNTTNIMVTQPDFKLILVTFEAPIVPLFLKPSRALHRQDRILGSHGPPVCGEEQPFPVNAIGVLGHYCGYMRGLGRAKP